jgi:hypothetical protein
MELEVRVGVMGDVDYQWSVTPPDQHIAGYELLGLAA